MTTNSHKNKIYVALSGGVDSAVAAALLVNAGYEVIGVYMKNWADNFGISAKCPWEQDIEDVRKVSETLDIPWKVYNFEKEYKERILDYFFAEYKAGRTPNPDILCNNLVKFDLFAKRAFAEGASHVATGHYARRQSPQGFPWEAQGKLSLYTALDPRKDQVYFLQRLSSAQLERALSPLGNYYKAEVRTLAQHFNLPNATKKDSQGICFIGDIDVRDFIRQHLSTKSGNIVEAESGRVVGKHEGLWFYTIGQRHGIEVSSPDLPYFVVEKRQKANELVVAKGHDNPLLLKDSVSISQLHAISDPFYEGQEVMVSLRYREKPKRTVIKKLSADSAQIVSQEKPFWAPAAGQGVMICESKGTRRGSTKRVTGNNYQKLLKQFTISETLEGGRSLRVNGSGIIC